MPLQSTSGAASYDAFGGGVAAVPKYIEDYFSTYLVTGDGTAPAVNNGIDLSTKGGLVWIKKRSAAGSHSLFDTARGANLRLISNDTAAQDSVNLSFTTTGFSNYTLDSGVTYASWSWAKAPKFFDVVTYTGNGSTGGQTINHNLGSTVGCIIVKRTDAVEQWRVYHTTQGVAAYAGLNSTAAFTTDSNNPWKTPTSTTFGVGDGTYWTSLNASGGTYVAYLFAHNAGGFGLTGTDNVISCGSFTTGGSGDFSVTLGYEPQWVLLKQSSGAGGNWVLFDTMRGMSNTNVARLIPNTSGAETNYSAPYCVPSATGFYSTAGGFFDAGETIIYIAIRRGPMKVPTSGTSVFDDNYGINLASAGTIFNSNMLVDMFINKGYSTSTASFVQDRLRGPNQYLSANTTGIEQTASDWKLDQMTGIGYATARNLSDRIGWMFRRAPSFFDEVCYTGGITSNPSHNLGVTPEMYIVKCRSSGTSDRGWYVYHSSYDTANNYILMNSSAGLASLAGVWSSGPTATTFGVENGYAVNDSGQTYVTYLFATCAGVSKVGEFSHLNGTATDVDCGFTSGARFILFKRYDDVGSWYVYDSARGIVSGNDPYLLLNSTAAEVTNTDYVDTYSAGFEISSTAPAAINASGGTFIFLAIA